MLARVATFTTLALLISRALYYLTAPLIPFDSPIPASVLFMFGPIIAALLTAWFFDRYRIVEMLALRARWTWWLVPAWLLPPILAAIAALITSAFPGVRWTTVAEGTAEIAAAQGLELTPELLGPLPPFWLMLVMAMVLGGVINTLVAMGEEVGWRGYLWTVVRPLGFWQASGITGVIWGLWHAPLILDGHNYGTGYAGYPWLGFLMIVLLTTGMSPILGYLRDRTQSAWPAALFHGTVNAVTGIFLLLQTGAGPLLSGLPGLAGVITLAGSAAGIAYLRRSESGE